MTSHLLTPSRDVERHRQANRARAGQQRSPEESLIPLTPRDRKKAIDLLKEIGRSGCSDTDELEQVGELQRMLMLNIKAEIQAVDDFGDITVWLDRKLCQ